MNIKTEVKLLNTNKSNNYIIGRNAVKEALNSSRVIDSIMVSENAKSLGFIISKAREKIITIKRVNKRFLDSLSVGNSHQGVIAVAGAKESCSVEDILDLASKKNENPFIIIADGIEDPHNLGAIIRTAECVGAHGVILRKRGATGLTETVEKASAGALEHVLVAKVSNISMAIENLKKRGLWIYAADMKGTLWTEENLKGSIALVIGSEGKGISENVRKKCDFFLSVPLKGKINSLNASVAGGILMYEVLRQRISI